MGTNRTKRNPSLSEERLRDIWNVNTIDHANGELADLDQLISSAVARCLKDEDRSEVSEVLSYLLGEEVSVHMLNAYTSEARRGHKIPADRFLALIAVTRRFDILDAVLRRVGGKALNERDAKVFQIGVDYVASVNASRTLRGHLEDLFAPLEP